MKGAKSPLRVPSSSFLNFLKFKKLNAAGRKDLFGTLSIPLFGGGCFFALRRGSGGVWCEKQGIACGFGGGFCGKDGEADLMGEGGRACGRAREGLKNLNIL